jgi:heat shock protein HslJ
MTMLSRSLALALLASLSACGGAASGRGASATPPSWDEAANTRYAGIEESPVVLSDGGWDGEPFDPDGFARPHVELVPDFWLSGDLDADGAPESAVLLSASSGAAGTDLYLAALARDGGAVDARTALVGNRVQVRDARIEGGRIVLDVVQAGPNDAMCCPGEKATRAFAFEGEALVEVDLRVTGRLTAGDLSGVEWVLVRLGHDEPAPAEPEITFAVEGDRVSGAGGCNRYFGQLRAGSGPGDLSIGLLGSTRMACAEPAMSLESRYLTALELVHRFGFVAGQLVLTSPDGAVGLWFRPRPPATK